MSRFANLADKPKVATEQRRVMTDSAKPPIQAIPTPATPPSRVGRKAIAAYFSPEMSMAMHVCARKNTLSLQALMTEAFNDVLRKYGQSPVGE